MTTRFCFPLNTSAKRVVVLMKAKSIHFIVCVCLI